jgi:hypothetical protein
MLAACQQVADPGQAHRAAGYALPRARGGHGTVPLTASPGSLRASRSRTLALSLQHRRSGPGSRRPSHQASRA